MFVFVAVSQATLEDGSCSRHASRIASETCGRFDFEERKLKADLVANLVGMTFVDGFRSEEKRIACHSDVENRGKTTNAKPPLMDRMPSNQKHDLTRF